MERSRTYLACLIQVGKVAGGLPDGHQAVRVARDAVTQTVALLQQTTIPNDIGALLGCAQISIVAECLKAPINE